MTKAVTVTFVDVTDEVTCQRNRDSDVRGCVAIVVSEPVEIIGCDIELSGRTQTNPLPSAHVPDDAWSLPPHLWTYVANNLRARDRQTHLSMRFVRRDPPVASPRRQPSAGPPLPLPCKVQGTVCRPHVLREMFRFQICHSIPESWPGNEDRNACVRYWLTARVSYVRTSPRLFLGCGSEATHEETATKDITIRNAFSLTALNATNPHLQNVDNDSDCVTRKVGLGGEKKEIYCFLRLPIRGFVLGDIIPAEICLFNKTRRTRPVSLRFLQEFTIRSRKVPSKPHVHVEEGGVMRLEPLASGGFRHFLAMGLRVPPLGCSDGSFPNCALIAVRFFVQLELRHWLHNTVTCRVECHVGTQRFSSAEDAALLAKPVINRGRLPLYPADFRARVHIQRVLRNPLCCLCLAAADFRARVHVADLPFTLLDPTPQ
ncbi:hypothetical protein ACOMHN_022810 [Nucella lapillus]